LQACEGLGGEDRLKPSADSKFTEAGLLARVVVERGGIRALPALAGRSG